MESPTINALLQGYWNAAELSINIVVFLHLLGALILGLIVGYERSYHGRAAGMRTYGLVCMASAALTVISGYPDYWFGGHADIAANTIDPTRVIQGIVTGIGFLGAGIIMKDGINISGLTTSASIWASSAIGILFGLGFHAAAIMLTFLSVGFMVFSGKIEVMLPKKHAIAVVLLFKSGHDADESVLHRLAADGGYRITPGSIGTIYRHAQHEWQFVAVSHGRPRNSSIIGWSKILSAAEGLESFRLTHARN